MMFVQFKNLPAMSEDKIQERRYGGIEAGGTKFVCAIGTGASDLQAVAEISTGEPESTIAEVIQFFRSQLNGDGKLHGLGIGSFGPVELNEDAPDYGCIKSTPKSRWQNVDIRGEFARALDVPVVIDTDVNVAAVGELQWGAARDLRHCLYVTVGTGIGVGAIVDGHILFGAQHPEMGHMLVPVSLDEPGEFAGVCPYHQSCAEGFASGTAIVQRWSSKLCDLPDNHPES